MKSSATSRSAGVRLRVPGSLPEHLRTLVGTRLLSAISSGPPACPTCGACVRRLRPPRGRPRPRGGRAERGRGEPAGRCSPHCPCGVRVCGAMEGLAVPGTSPAGSPLPCLGVGARGHVPCLRVGLKLCLGFGARSSFPTAGSWAVSAHRCFWQNLNQLGARVREEA